MVEGMVIKNGGLDWVLKDDGNENNEDGECEEGKKEMAGFTLYLIAISGSCRKSLKRMWRVLILGFQKGRQDKAPKDTVSS